jgi:MCP family monocarboxylic acid transporter-like MFS transporter 10
MIGGSILMVFCILMISITTPEHYYQACIFAFPTSTDITNIPSKLFLSQGLGIGIAVGITYIPALGIISHYFQRRRALALGIAASVGCHPPIIILTLITEPGLCFWRSGSPHYAESFVSRISWVSLRCESQCWIGRWPSHNFPVSHETAIPTKYEEGRKYTQQLSGFPLRYSQRYYGFGVSYSIVQGYFAHVDRRRRTTLIYSGSYYPIFFLQLNAIKNGIAPQLAFYTVQRFYFIR